MQPISQITANLTQRLPQGMPQNSLATSQALDMAQPSQQLVVEIGLMFSQWKLWFKNKMRTRDEGEADWGADMVLVWAKYLTKKSITQREFNQAKDLVIEELDFPPNNAKEFLELVRGESNKPYPSTDKAFHIACQNCGMRGVENRDWLHVTVYETANRLGFNRLASATESFIGQFEKVYNQVISEFENGQSFVIPESNQIEHKHIPADKSVADDALAKIFAIVGKKAVA